MPDSDLTTALGGACRTQRVTLPAGERTWTVLDPGHRVVEPAEQYLEYLRMLGRSPNTVKSYARAFALWWQFLDAYELAWDAVTIEDLGRFLGWLRSGDEPGLASIERRPARFSEGTVALRLQAVCSLYRYHHFNGVEAPRASMSVCSPAGTPTSRCSSTSRAGGAMSAESCASRGRDRRRRQRSRRSR